jgi:DNA replication licensing factor MCM2
MSFYEFNQIKDDEDDQLMRMPRRRRHRAGETDLMDEDEMDPSALDPNFVLDDLKGRTIAEWLTMDQPRRHVAHRFRKFLTEFVDSHGNSVYEDKIQRMCEANGRSLEVSYSELYGEQPLLALWVADAPAEMLVIFNSVATEMVKERFSRYDRISGEINVRIYDLPTQETIRDLR